MIPSSPSIPAAPSLAEGTRTAVRNVTRAELLQAAQWLRERYQRHPHLMHEQQGWNLRLTLQPSDPAPSVVLDIRDGQLAEIQAVSDGLFAPDVSPQTGSPADVRGLEHVPGVLIQGPLRVLCDVLWLRQPPSEPYLFGELIVLGPEPEFLRLDYIVSTLAQSLETP